MRLIKLKVNTGTAIYPIIIGSNIISKFSKILHENSIKFEKCLLVIDKKVPKKIYSQIKKILKKKKIFTHFINANEKNKNQKNVNILVETLLKKIFQGKIV